MFLCRVFLEKIYLDWPKGFDSALQMEIGNVVRSAPEVADVLLTITCGKTELCGLFPLEIKTFDIVTTANILVVV